MVARGEFAYLVAEIVVAKLACESTCCALRRRNFYHAHGSHVHMTSKTEPDAAEQLRRAKALQSVLAK